MSSKKFPSPEDIFGNEAKQKLVDEVIDFIRTELEKAEYVQKKIKIELSKLPHTSDRIVDQALIQIEHCGWKTWRGKSTKNVNVVVVGRGNSDSYEVEVIEIRWT